MATFRPIQIITIWADECKQSLKWFRFQNTYGRCVTQLPTESTWPHSPGASGGRNKFHYRAKFGETMYSGHRVATKYCTSPSLKNQSSDGKNNEKNYPDHKWVVAQRSQTHINKSRHERKLCVQVSGVCLLGRTKAIIIEIQTLIVNGCFFPNSSSSPSYSPPVGLLVGSLAIQNQIKRKNSAHTSADIYYCQSKAQQASSTQRDWMAAFARVIPGRVACIWHEVLARPGTDSVPLLIFVIRIRGVPHHH